MADGRTLTLGHTGSRDAAVGGRSGTRISSIGRSGSRGTTIDQTSFTASAIVPPADPPPPADLADPRNSNLIGDWI